MTIFPFMNTPKFGGPEIEPHIPILGSIQMMSREDALNKFRFAPMDDIVAKVDRVITKNYYHQCVSLLMDQKKKTWPNPRWKRTRNRRHFFRLLERTCFVTEIGTSRRVWGATFLGLLERVGAGDWLAANVPCHVGGEATPPSRTDRPSTTVLRHTIDTSILASTFAAGICDPITFARSVKASNMTEACGDLNET
ncbi:unnamed protein product [Malus baccata var. baccata]